MWHARQLRTTNMKHSRILSVSILLALTIAAGIYLTSRSSYGPKTPAPTPSVATAQPQPADLVLFQEVPRVATTVCSLVSKPDSYLGKLIVLEGDVQSDCRHYTLIVDQACNRGISFTVPESVEPQWEVIDNSLCVGLTRKSKQIRAKFTGLFVRESGPSDGLFPYIVRLRAIENVSIR